MAAPILLGIFLLAMALLVPLLGADTRDGRDWRPRDVALWHRHDGE